MSSATASQVIHLPSGRTVTIRPAVVIEETPIQQRTVDQLYGELERWIAVRSRNGGRTPAAYHARSVYAREIERIKRELRRRGKPVDRLLYDAELREADARDEAAMYNDLRYGG